MGRKANVIDASEVCRLYTEGTIGVEALATRFHVGKLKIKAILAENGIDIKKRGAQVRNTGFVVSDWSVRKYEPKEGFHYVATDRNSGFRTNDYENRAGVLTTHISNEYGVEIPTLYNRRMYYMRTGNYWWEQWFDITLEKDMETKKCPYCNWTTTDIHNNSGAFEVHLKKVHGITKEDYLSQHPEERDYFRLANQNLDLQMETDTDKFVVCKVCGAKLRRITNHHLVMHGMTKNDYIEKFGSSNLCSPDYHRKQSEASIITNMNMPVHRDSKAEKEISDFIRSNGIECKRDRKILEGKEIDIYIPSIRIGFEYDGNLWHSEWFGHKSKDYHLGKLELCNSKNVGLVTIFEDEWELHKDIVKSKITHLIGVDSGKSKVYGRKCTVREIFKSEAESFLESNHIQGFSNSTLYIGAFFQDRLIGVASFTNEGDGVWNLSRMATDISVVCCGVCGKMFKYFTKNYNFTEIKSFADRRWTVDISDNLYTNLGFTVDGITKPDYKYYNPKVDRYKRFHKFGFRKQILHRRHGLPLSMTETEMARSLGYDRIWDCGLIRYVYRKKS